MRAYEILLQHCYFGQAFTLTVLGIKLSSTISLRYTYKLTRQRGDADNLT